MIKRRKLSGKELSTLRPSLKDRTDLEVHELCDALKRFTSEYLRSAAELEIIGQGAATVNISLEGTAYLLRLLVEYTGESSVLTIKLRISEHMTLECEICDGPLSFDDLSKIAAAGRNAGFHFEMRGNSFLFRTRLTQLGRVSVYSGETSRLYTALLEIFFG